MTTPVVTRKLPIEKPSPVQFSSAGSWLFWML